MHGAIGSMTETTIKSISAVKPKREGGHSRAMKRRGGQNVRWKRVTDSIDEAVKALHNCPPERYDELVKIIAETRLMAVPVTRLRYFGHITVTQAIAARRYADIIRKFERFHMASSARSARSANLQPARGVEDTEIERIHVEGRLKEYEAAAKVAKREYRRLMKVIDKFADPVTGRNHAKDQLDNLCIFDREPPSEARASIGAVLSMVAKEFGIEARS